MNVSRYLDKELGIEGEVGADTVTREIKMVVMTEDMSIIQMMMLTAK